MAKIHRLTNTSLIIKVLTTIQMSVARSACSSANKSLKSTSLNPQTSLPTTTYKKTMFNRRLISIVQSEGSNRSSAAVPRRARTRTPEWVRRQWDRVFAKIQIIFRFIRDALGVRAIVGEDNFKKFLQDSDINRMATQENDRQESRVVRSAVIRDTRFIFGEILPPYMGEPTATLQPDECDHPNEALQLLGNKYQKSVYCKRCHKRWRRTDLQNLQCDLRDEPRDDHVLSYGRFITWTYLEVYRNHPGYCR